MELPEDPAVLAALDAYEEFDPTNPGARLFVRKKAQAQLSDGGILECWVYSYNGRPSESAIIPSGSYAGSKTP